MKRFIGIALVFALFLTLFSACSSGGSSSGGYDVAYGLIDYADYKITSFYIDWVDDEDYKLVTMHRYGGNYDHDSGELDLEYTLADILGLTEEFSEFSIKNGTFSVKTTIYWSQIETLLTKMGVKYPSQIELEKEDVNEWGASFCCMRLSRDDQVLWICIAQTSSNFFSDYIS